ncbi:MAG: DUF4097 family beta strand repeat protein [Phycisphaerae bacterium]|nr:DUF4097 family beta strand repeat protein [Phycisphaerae bacterium]
MMADYTRLIVVSSLFLLVGGCEISFVGDPAGGGLEIPSSDGIDPSNPRVERTTTSLDMTDVRNIRIELPTARVHLSQAGEGTAGSLQVTKIITREGFQSDALADLLSRSVLTAERSFVDNARLDVEATLPKELADTDLVFDIRLVVPVSVSVEVILKNGPVDVVDISGNVEVRTANGAVSLKSIQGNVIAQTTNRGITIADTAGNVKAVTTDADISLRLAPAPDGAISAETASGNIRFTLAKTTTARLDLQTASGSVSANLGGFTVSDVTTGGGYLQGILNGGGGSIVARSESGEITFVGM